jgi:hypothetical protein
MLYPQSYKLTDQLELLLSGIRDGSSALAGGITLKVAWKLLLIQSMPALLALAISICIFGWGGGRIDV